MRQKIKEIVAETQNEPTQIDRIAQALGWFRPAQNSVFYPTVQDYANGAKDLKTTINDITKPIDEASAAGKIDEVDLQDLWNSIFHTVKRIPYRNTESHSKLIELLKTIKKHPEPEPAREEPIYSSLSGFSMASREAYNDSPESESGVSTAEINAWANLNYFLARVTAAEISDMSLYAIFMMREALEQKSEDVSPSHYDAHVPAAAMWVFGLDRKLYEREEDMSPKTPNQGNPARGGALWTGGSEFSKARWTFWKKRFGEVSEDNEVSNETRSVAKEAAEAMRHVETS